MRIDRLLAITILMLNRDRITARELADKFEVSIRTIYRDLEAMNLAGIPVVSYSGNNGGYGIMENYRIDRRLLSSQDITSILSALHGVNRTLDDKSLSLAIDKIASLVPRDQSQNLMQNLEQVVIDILPWGDTPGRSADIRLLHQSIAAHKLVEFSYLNSKGENSIRKAEPMTLLFKGYSWYLFGFCLLKNDYRFFRLSRMKNLKILSVSFIRRDKSYKNCLGPMVESGNPIEFVLRFSPEVNQFIEDSFEGEQIEPQPDGSIIVRFIMPLSEWTYGFILSFGENVEVLSPENVRKRMSEKIKKIHSIYKPDIGLS
jgi:predicted DNA-binding transcriptional regulator YafY